MAELSRRGFLAAAGGTVAGAFLAADAHDLLAAGRHAAWAGRQTPPPPFQVLTAEQAADVETLAAQIIPTDETPGAREARVVHFVDRALATFAKEQRPVFEKGLASLRARVQRKHPRAPSFAALASAQQIALMREMEKARDPFFDAVRGATIVGMFASPEYGGNHDRLGWKLLGFEDRFSWAPPFGWYDRAGS